jgi:hypothetical protein
VSSDEDACAQREKRERKSTDEPPTMGDATHPARARDLCNSNSILHQQVLAARSFVADRDVLIGQVLLQPGLLGAEIVAAPILRARGVTRCADG